MQFRYFGTLRFFLALLVVFHHFGLHLAAGPISAIAKSWLPGVAAVLIFFVLCGFVMAESATSIYERRPGAFLLNRALRIIPPFWIALSIQILVHLLLPNGTGHSGAPLPADAFTSINLIGNYFYFWPSAWPWDYHNPYDFLFIFWTLRYEIVFYVIIAAALYIAHGNRRILTDIFIAGSISVLFGAIYFRFIAVGPWAGFHTGHWPFFTIGVVAFFIEREATITRQAILFLALVVAIAGLPYITPYDIKTVFHEAALFSGLLYVSYILANLKSDIFRVQDDYLGSLSYSLYLTHVIVMTTFLHLGISPGLFAFFAALVTALVFAILFNLVVERWLKVFRDRVRGKSITSTRTEFRNDQNTSGSGASRLITARVRV